MSEPINDKFRAKDENGRSSTIAIKESSFLLQPEPEAMLTVELVDKPVQLSFEQFEALLIDSECEV